MYRPVGYDLVTLSVDGKATVPTAHHSTTRD